MQQNASPTQASKYLETIGDTAGYRILCLRRSHSLFSVSDCAENESMVKLIKVLLLRTTYLVSKSTHFAIVELLTVYSVKSA